MGNTEEYEVFNRSLWRTMMSVIDGVSFVDAFMESLIGVSEEVASKFTEAGRQRMSNAVQHSILHLAAYSQAREASDALRAIARRQSRKERDIAPHLYDVFLTCLLHVVARYDPEHTDEVGEAWRHVLTPGLEYMKAMYDS